MLAEWSAECAAEDPVLVVPWSDAVSGAAFVDLTANPYDFEAIPEAERHPALLQALRALNAPRSPVFTAKCDAWTMQREELDGLREELLFSDACAAGFASYVDLVFRERSRFASFARHEQSLRRLAQLAEPLAHPEAMFEAVLRPAFLELHAPQEGFAVSLYVKALGADALHAYAEWERALAAVATLLRCREMAR